MRTAPLYTDPWDGVQRSGRLLWLGPAPGERDADLFALRHWRDNSDRFSHIVVAWSNGRDGYALAETAQFHHTIPPTIGMSAHRGLSSVIGMADWARASLRTAARRVKARGLVLTEA